MNSIIQCENLSYSYDDGNHQTSVNKGLNLSVNKGESIAILGQSGSGKSTLLNLIGGMDKPTQGTVFINGKNLTTLDEQSATLMRAQNLGFVYQFHHLLKDFSALDNVAMPLLIAGEQEKNAQKNAAALLDQIGLGHRTNHRPSELSGGERQRVAIARALITKPHCVLADEPTGNLDAQNAEAALELMLRLNQQQETALIVVTHDNNVANKMNRVLVLKNGVLNES